MNDLKQQLMERSARGHSRGSSAVWADASSATRNRKPGLTFAATVVAVACAGVLLAALLSRHGTTSPEVITAAADTPVSSTASTVNVQISPTSSTVDVQVDEPTSGATIEPRTPLAEELTVGPEELNVAYQQCVSDAGLNFKGVQVIVDKSGKPVHVKTAAEVPAAIHGPCLEAIGGTTEPGLSSWGLKR